jgi:hypothetical protein
MDRLLNAVGGKRKDRSLLETSTPKKGRGGEFDDSIVDPFVTVLSAIEALSVKVDDMAKQQNTLKNAMMEKLTEMEQRIEIKIGNHCAAVKEELNKEIEGIKEQVDGLDKKLYEVEDSCKKEFITIKSRVEKVEEVAHSDFQPDVSLIVVGLQQEDNDRVKERCEKLFEDGLGLGVTVKKAVRLTSNKVVKVEMKTKEDRMKVLKSKARLKDKNQFQRIYIHPALSHAEYIAQQNSNTLLHELNMHGRLRVAENGRIVSRDTDRGGNRNGDGGGEWQEVRGRGRGRGRGTGGRGGRRGRGSGGYGGY